jgi:hypothetical protein
MKLSKLGRNMAVTYLVAFFVIMAAGVITIPFVPDSSLLWGGLALLITLPWSFVVFGVLNALGYITWSGSFEPWFCAMIVILGFLPGALINTTGLYFLGKKIDSSRKKAHKKHSAA